MKTENVSWWIKIYVIKIAKCRYTNFFFNSIFICICVCVWVVSKNRSFLHHVYRERREKKLLSRGSIGVIEFYLEHRVQPINFIEIGNEISDRSIRKKIPRRVISINRLGLSFVLSISRFGIFPSRLFFESERERDLKI